MEFHSYHDMFRFTRDQGEEIPSRIGPTREAIGATLIVPAASLPLRPRMNRALGYMELVQLIAGAFEKGAIERVAPNADLALFTDQAAYGPRTFSPASGRPMADQLKDALLELRTDPGSRRATILLARPGERPGERPCTSSLQFLLRHNLLHCVVSMRSWDLWYGAPYDLMMFGGLTRMLANLLDVAAGNIRVTAGSAHIYQKHWSKILTTNNSFGFNLPFLDTLADYRKWARDCTYDFSWVGGPPPGVSEVLHRDRRVTAPAGKRPMVVAS